MYSTEETEIKEGTMVGLGDIGILMEDLDEDEFMFAAEETLSTFKLTKQTESAQFAILFGVDTDSANEDNEIQQQEITIVQDIIQVLNSQFDRQTLTIQLPQTLNLLKDVRPNFEIITSKVIQPVNLMYQRNYIVHKIAYIFVNSGNLLPHKNAEDLGRVA